MSADQPARLPPLNYDEARACTALAERAREVDLAESGERGASTMRWWRSTLEQHHREIAPLNWQALNALPRGALWPRLLTIRRTWTRHMLARVNAAKQEGIANVG
jgi:hypothetical protein